MRIVRPSSAAGPSVGSTRGAPTAFWLAVLALGSPWIRVFTPWGAIYPGQWLLVPILVWALWRGPLVNPGGMGQGGARNLPPLMPLVLLGAWIGGVGLLRGQWGVVMTILLSAAALAVWAWAAYRLGRDAAPMGSFAPASFGFLALSLLAGLASWAAQAYLPQACRIWSCEAAAPVPFAFQGGWISPGQYLVALIFLLPPVGGLVVEGWRQGPARQSQEIWAHAALALVLAAAGLGALAGMRWWGFGVLGFGWLLVGQALAAEPHPADRLLMRGLAFFLVLAALALYGMVPGYRATLVNQPGGARVLGVRHTLGSPVVLSSEHAMDVPVTLVNAGSIEVDASPTQPVRLQAKILFTPRSGGESHLAPAGSGHLLRNLAPGDTQTLTVSIQVPAWIAQGYLSWAVEDDSGRSIPLAQDVQEGFRFVNGEYSSLAESGDNTLTALAARARAVAALVPPAANPQGLSSGARRNLIEPILSDAFDTLFFSPIWGQSGPPRPPGQVFEPSRSLVLQVLHRYGLVGLGLLAWFFLDLMRRSVRLGFGRSFSAGLAWRFVPVSVLLLACMAIFSGEPARFHSVWGCVLLGGFVQGVYERRYPPRGSSRAPSFAPGRMLVGALQALVGAGIRLIRPRERHRRSTYRGGR
jgi:hypothetical protein